MKTKASLFFLLLILIGCTVVNAAEQPKEVPDQLWQKVQNKVWAKLWEDVRSRAV